MEIEVKEKEKRVYIWLTKEESCNEQINEQLKPLFKECKSNGYLAVVYRSGTEDLVETIRALLLYNIRRSAELRKEKERKIVDPVGNSVAAQMAEERKLAIERKRKRAEIRRKLEEGTL